VIKTKVKKQQTLFSTNMALIENFLTHQEEVSESCTSADMSEFMRGDGALAGAQPGHMNENILTNIRHNLFDDDEDEDEDDDNIEILTTTNQ
jgi:hypothetical protein